MNRSTTKMIGKSNITLIVTGLLLCLPLGACEQDQKAEVLPGDKSEALKIRKVCLDYAEGFFESNPVRLSRALHPDLVKRTCKDNAISNLTREELIKIAQADERDMPEITVDVLDIHNDIATAKITSLFIDYVQLIKMNDQWQIVNVVWIGK